MKVKTIITRRLNVNEEILSIRSTPLVIAVKEGDLRAVRKFLAEGAQVDKVTSKGETALFAACAMNRADIVEELITHRADALKTIIRPRRRNTSPMGELITKLFAPLSTQHNFLNHVAVKDCINVILRYVLFHAEDHAQDAWVRRFAHLPIIIDGAEKTVKWIWTHIHLIHFPQNGEHFSANEFFRTMRSIIDNPIPFHGLRDNHFAANDLFRATVSFVNNPNPLYQVEEISDSDDDYDEKKTVLKSTAVPEQPARFEYSEDLPQKYRCPICFDALYQPVITSAGSIYCKECITAAFRSGTKRDPLTNVEVTRHVYDCRFIRDDMEQYQMNRANHAKADLHHTEGKGEEKNTSTTTTTTTSTSTNKHIDE